LIKNNSNFNETSDQELWLKKERNQ